MEFPPDRSDLIHEDVKALFKLAGVTWHWKSAGMVFRVLLHDETYYADMLIEPDQLQCLETAQHFVGILVAKLEELRAR